MERHGGECKETEGKGREGKGMDGNGIDGNGTNWKGWIGVGEINYLIQICLHMWEVGWEGKKEIFMRLSACLSVCPPKRIVFRC